MAFWFKYVSWKGYLVLTWMFFSDKFWTSRAVCDESYGYLTTHFLLGGCDPSPSMKICEDTCLLAMFCWWPFQFGIRQVITHPLQHPDKWLIVSLMTNHQFLPTYANPSVVNCQQQASWGILLNPLPFPLPFGQTAPYTRGASSKPWRGGSVPPHHWRPRRACTSGRSVSVTAAQGD